MPHPDQPYRVEKKRENITMSISHASPPNPKKQPWRGQGSAFLPWETSKGIIADLIQPPKAPPAVRGPNPSSFCSLVRERRQ